MKRFISMFAPLLGVLLVGCSQKPPIPEGATVSTRVYTYVEKMPQLPEGGGNAAIISAIMKRLRVPAATPAADLESYTSGPKVSFIIRPNGQIDSAQIMTSCNSPLIDRAVLKAINSLPKLVPGYQHDTAVAVRLMSRISCLKFQ